MQSNPVHEFYLKQSEPLKSCLPCAKSFFHRIKTSLTHGNTACLSFAIAKKCFVTYGYIGNITNLTWVS